MKGWKDFSSVPIRRQVETMRESISDDICPNEKVHGGQDANKSRACSFARSLSTFYLSMASDVLAEEMEVRRTTRMPN